MRLLAKAWLVISQLSVLPLGVGVGGSGVAVAAIGVGSAMGVLQAPNNKRSNTMPVPLRAMPRENPASACVYPPTVCDHQPRAGIPN